MNERRERERERERRERERERERERRLTFENIGCLSKPYLIPPPADESSCLDDVLVWVKFWCR